MTLTDEERQHLQVAAEHLPQVYADGGRALADDLRTDLPDLSDVQLCRVVLALSGAITDLILAVDKHTGGEPVDATIAVACLDGTALELARIERGSER